MSTREQKPNPVTVSVRRLLRRATAHGVAQPRVRFQITQAHVLFAGRHIRIRSDGTMVQNMFPFPCGDTVRSDPHWRSASNNSFHATELAWAAECRRRRWLEPGRLSVAAARRERNWSNV